MTYGITWRHADGEYRHESIVNWLAEALEVYVNENTGLELWFDADVDRSLVHYQVYENEAHCGLMLLTDDPARITRITDRVTCPACRQQVEYEREFVFERRIQEEGR